MLLPPRRVTCTDLTVVASGTDEPAVDGAVLGVGDVLVDLLALGDAPWFVRPSAAVPPSAEGAVFPAVCVASQAAEECEGELLSS